MRDKRERTIQYHKARQQFLEDHYLFSPRINDGDIEERHQLDTPGLPIVSRKLSVTMIPPKTPWSYPVRRKVMNKTRDTVGQLSYQRESWLWYTRSGKVMRKFNDCESMRMVHTANHMLSLAPVIPKYSFLVFEVPIIYSQQSLEGVKGLEITRILT